MAAVALVVLPPMPRTAVPRVRPFDSSTKATVPVGALAPLAATTVAVRTVLSASVMLGRLATRTAAVLTTVVVLDTVTVMLVETEEVWKLSPA